MKALHMIALGSVLSASLVIAQAQTAPATTTAAQQTTKTTKSKKKAKADASSAIPAPVAKTATGPAAPAAPAVKAATPAAAPAAATSAKPSAAPKALASKTPPPNAGDIADAKAKGLVWVNLNTKVYHGASDKEYGATKNGKFMTEADAKAAGVRIAKK